MGTVQLKIFPRTTQNQRFIMPIDFQIVESKTSLQKFKSKFEFPPYLIKKLSKTQSHMNLSQELN